MAATVHRHRGRGTDQWQIGGQLSGNRIAAENLVAKPVTRCTSDFVPLRIAVPLGHFTPVVVPTPR